MSDAKWTRLCQTARAFYDNGDPGHDWAHIQRVIRLCETLGAEEGADLALLRPAALLHDVVNVPKNHPDRVQASRRAAAIADDLLAGAGYAPEEVERIRQIIIEHSYSLGLKPSSVESAILQDADRLDALGAVGIMRWVSCGTRMGAAFYDLEDPWAQRRALDDRSFSVDHLFTKLLKLSETLNTRAARSEGERRTRFLEEFVEHLKNEI